MQAVVLAGGYATRLWPITKNRPKMFLPFDESTVIDRIFDELESDDRVSEVYVSTNERFAEAFRDHLDGAPYDKPRLSVEETRAEEEKFGVVGALAELVEREGLDEDTLVIAGDNVFSFAVGDFLDFFAAREAPSLAAYDVGSVERAKSYGLVELDGERVVGFQEKPDRPRSTLVSIACYAFPAEALSLLEEYLEGGNNPDEPGWFIQWLYRRRPVFAYTFDGAWFDIGTPRSYLDAIAWSLGGDNHVAPKVTVENTDLEGNVYVMRGAELVDSRLESSVIFPDARIEDCDLRRSIIDENTHLENLDLADALIGAHTQITNGPEG